VLIVALNTYLKACPANLNAHIWQCAIGDAAG
jgi:hypothetical protein